MEHRGAGRRAAGAGFRRYLPRLTALRESDLLSDPELFPEEDEADADDLPVDWAAGLGSDLAAERALAEEFELLRATAPEPESRGAEVCGEALLEE